MHPKLLIEFSVTQPPGHPVSQPNISFVRVALSCWLLACCNSLAEQLSRAVKQSVIHIQSVGHSVSHLVSHSVSHTATGQLGSWMGLGEPNFTVVGSIAEPWNAASSVAFIVLGY